VVFGSTDITLIGNSAVGHSADGTVGLPGAGFVVAEATSNTLEDNSASGNFYGMVAWSAADNLISGNAFDDNVVGLWLGAAHGNVATANTAGRNTQAGFEIAEGSSGNFFGENVASHNAQVGFTVAWGVDNEFTANEALRNRIGFQVHEPSNGNAFTSNYARNAWLDQQDLTPEGANTWIDNDFKWVIGSGGWR
jgi:parallel beta-helix repeat protein